MELSLVQYREQMWFKGSIAYKLITHTKKEICYENQLHIHFLFSFEYLS